MVRLGLKKLLEDIAANKIDTVVVYTVDRLTRALADFAALPQAVVQPGHRAPRRPGGACVQRSARVRRLRRGARGDRGVRAEAQARLRALPRSRFADPVVDSAAR